MILFMRVKVKHLQVFSYHGQAILLMFVIMFDHRDFVFLLKQFPLLFLIL
jgi:hypothetical protein